jgi:hypothetical protein
VIFLSTKLGMVGLLLKSLGIRLLFWISIFGSQSEYKIHEMPEEKLNTMPPIMKSLIDHRAGLTYLSDGLVKINRSEKLEGIMPDGIYNTNDPSSGWKLLQPWISLSRFIAAVLRRK